MFLSDNFSLAELTLSNTAIRRGLANNPPETVFENLKVTAAGMERVLAVLGHPVLVVSGYRSPLVNQLMGGSPASQHTHGWAIDFICPAVGDPYEVCCRLSEAKDEIVYDQLIHEFRAWAHISFEPHLRKQDLSLFQAGRLMPGIQQ